MSNQADKEQKAILIKYLGELYAKAKDDWLIEYTELFEKCFSDNE